MRPIRLGCLLGCLLAVSCSPNRPPERSDRRQVDAALRKLQDEASRNEAARQSLESELRTLRQERSEAQARQLNAATEPAEVKEQSVNMDDLDARIRGLEARLRAATERLDTLERTFTAKMQAGNLVRANFEMLTGNRERYGSYNTPTRLVGQYRVLVIPVEFSDVKFSTPDVRQELDSRLFRNPERSLASYFRTASGGVFHVDGVVAQPVMVPGKQGDYGRPTEDGSDHDVATRPLGAEALALARSQEASLGGFDQFDQWDLNDYDGDGNFHERDGFADAVVYVVAGQDEAVCTGVYSIPAKKESCDNSIWPHRWTLRLPPNHPQQAARGPVVEGVERPIRGVVMNDRVQAWDYNMQTESSATSTFIHEFGHSLTLGDLYAYSGDNNIGEWDVMSYQVEGDTAQHLTSFQKMLLGWLNPKVVDLSSVTGGETSLYLGDSNFYSPAQRAGDAFPGGREVLPRFLTELLNGQNYFSSVISTASGEGVYRAAQIYLPDYERTRNVIEWVGNANGKAAAYSGQGDNLRRTYSFSLRIPDSGKSILTFETLHRMETETNFESSEPNEAVRITNPWDVAEVRINGQLDSTLVGISGDRNGNGLNETAPGCDEARLFVLRSKWLDGTIGTEETEELLRLKDTLCAQPSWENHSIDLGAHKGEVVRFELTYLTDGNTQDLGLFVDNLRLDNQTLEDFETATARTGDFQLSEQGRYSEKFGHFYVVEYRDPVTPSRGMLAHDTLMTGYSQGFFAPESSTGEPLVARFRYARQHPQPGALLWYYHPRFTDNEVAKNDGQGMLLPIQSKVRELRLPSSLGSDEILAQDPVLQQPTYALTSDAYQAARRAQRLPFACFGLQDYYQEISQEGLDCSSVPASDWNGLKRLSLNGRQLIVSTEAYLNTLPGERRRMELILTPFSGVGTKDALTGAPSLRSSTATFRSPEMGSYRPFEIFKVEEGGTALVSDDALNAAVPAVEPVSEFSDSDYSSSAPWVAHPRFGHDSAVVIPVGLQMSFSSPDLSVTGAFDSSDPDDARFKERAPRIKISIRR